MANQGFLINNILCLSVVNRYNGSSWPSSIINYSHSGSMSEKMACIKYKYVESGTLSINRFERTFLI